MYVGEGNGPVLEANADAIQEGAMSMFSMIYRYVFRYRILAVWLVLGLPSGIFAAEAASERPLAVAVAPGDCRFSVNVEGSSAIVLSAGIAAKVDHTWLHSGDYPKCSIAKSEIVGTLGSAQQWVVEYSGLDGKPNLGYTLRSYAGKPLADIQATVINQTGQVVNVEDIRSIESSRGIDLGGPSALDRVLSDSFSEDRPSIRIRDLGDSLEQMHRGVGSQLIFNRQTHRSLFVGALSSERFLTILRLHVGGTSSNPSIQSYEVDSTGTTEMEIAAGDSLHGSPEEDRIALSLPVQPGESLAAERLLVGVDNDPHRQLEAYGDLIRTLHHPRPAGPTPIGWWSWTAFKNGMNEGAALTSAQWLAQNLKPLGYSIFEVDDGYQYAYGEYTTPDASLFPHGVRALDREVTALGLTPGVWTSPFEVGQRSWVYENHPEWLVHNAQGKPIVIALDRTWDSKEPLYVLDTTHPEAQEFLRKTYITLTRDWGVRYIKLDFMDDSAVEGFYFKPHTTALEAQRTGLAVIRDAVGNAVLLDKDGSVMLNPVGFVDEGRISNDSGPCFDCTKGLATGIAARYYMNHNFYTSDPDAFMVATHKISPQGQEGNPPFALEEAKVSIAISAVSGGMYEIGDNLPTLSLGIDAERLALAKNPDLLDMARLGRASTPVDLMDYTPEDEQPSIFYLREDPQQSVLTVFNWTGKPRTHTFQLTQFGFPATDAKVKATDVFTGGPISLSPQDILVVEQPPQSVRIFRLQDTTAPRLQPSITAKHVQEGHTSDELAFSATSSNNEEPVLAYEWDFGDGVTAAIAAPSHAYTTPGTYLVHVKVKFLNGITAEDRFTLPITDVTDTVSGPMQKRRLTQHD